MSSQSWWTTITPEEIIALRRKVFAKIERQYGPSLGSEVEDVVNDAFVALFRNCHEVRAENNGLYRYLLVSARNAAISYLRREKTREEGAEKLRQRTQELLGRPSETEAIAIREGILKVFNELASLKRSVIWRYFVDEESIRSIAGQTNLNWHQVANIIDEWVALIRWKFLQ